MKHEIGISQPSYLVEDWPNKYQVFSWNVRGTVNPLNGDYNGLNT